MGNVKIAPKLFKNAEKVELITQLHSCGGERATHLLLELLPVMIQEFRELNDTAVADEVIKNQGKIEALKDLLYYVENGVGTTK